MKPVVLVVEDNERNRKLVRTILEFKGYEVVELDDGEHVVRTAKECKPVLVLMDIELQKVDGIRSVLQRAKGTCQVELAVYDPAGKQARLRLGRDYWVNPNNLNLQELELLLGPGSVIFTR